MSITLLVHHIFEGLINPLMLMFVVFAVSLVWLFVYGNGRLVRYGLLVAFVGLLALSTRWIPVRVSDYLQCQYPVVAKVNPAVHWVVVFSGGMLDNTSAPVNQLLGSVTIARLLEGVRLYRSLPNATLILSGGDDTISTTSSAEQMGLLAAWFSIPKGRMIFEKNSLNTADEAVEIKQWVKKDAFYLVTSSVHMPRAMALCRKQGLNPIAAPADYPYPEVNRWERRVFLDARYLALVRDSWHEMMGLAWGKLSGLI